MIYSMTGFLQKNVKLKNCDLFFELFSFNSRYIEIFLNIPDFLKELEFVLRNKIRSKLKRGKVYLNIRVEFNSDTKNKIFLNKELAKDLIKIANLIMKNGCNGQLNPVDIFNWPGVLYVQKNKISLNFDCLFKELDCILFDFLVVRSNEGEFLKKIIEKRLDLIKKEIHNIRNLFPQILKINYDRLKSRFYNIKFKIDSDRLEQELVLFSQKIDITEELDRMDFYVSEIKKVLKFENAIGKHLGFLVQELNREANTISSKSTSVEIIDSGIRLKILIEEVREQIQNIE